MLSPEQLHQIRTFAHQYLDESAASSTQEWTKQFPRAAEHRWHHTLNVLRNAELILAGENASPASAEIVRVAVFLHDVSMFVSDHEVHGAASAHIAEEYLRGMGLPSDFVASVTRAVAEHGTDLGPLPPSEQGALFSWEGKVVLEADILDKLGACAIAAALLSAGAKGALAHEAHTSIVSGPVMERAAIFKDYVWTTTGRRLAEERFAFFLSFLEQLKAEVHDPLDEAAA
jgi:uncharacterized protein